MKLVVIESPFAGEVKLNLVYARRCVLDSLRRGEAPYASHLFFTQEGILDDDKLEERDLGIRAGFMWGEMAVLRAFYIDRGISRGMILGHREAQRIGQAWEVRALDRDVVPRDIWELQRRVTAKSEHL